MIASIFFIWTALDPTAPAVAANQHAPTQGHKSGLRGGCTPAVANFQLSKSRAPGAHETITAEMAL
jgi:hypothetical protein